MSGRIKVKQLIGSVIDMVFFALFTFLIAFTDVIVTKNSSSVGISQFIGVVGLVIGIIACLDSLNIIHLDEIKRHVKNEE